MTKEKRPGLVAIHGGGWRSGAKENTGSMAAAYAKNGYVAISINYRLVQKQNYRQIFRIVKPQFVG